LHAELLAIAEVRHLFGRRSESGFLAEVRDWDTSPVPAVTEQGHHRTPLAVGALEQLRAAFAVRLPEDDCQQVDTSTLSDSTR
jgi:hypothetical protein